MKLPTVVETELQAIERWIEALPGQKAGPARLRSLRVAIHYALRQAGECRHQHTSGRICCLPRDHEGHHQDVERVHWEAP